MRTQTSLCSHWMYTNEDTSWLAFSFLAKQLTRSTDEIWINPNQYDLDGQVRNRNALTIFRLTKFSKTQTKTTTKLAESG